MKFYIKDREVELKFGLKFCRELDQVYKVDYQGLEFGMGVNLAYMNLQQANPVALTEVIKATTAHLGFAMHEIDQAIETYAEKEGDLSKLFEQIETEMGKSATVIHTIKTFNQQAKASES
ncbi:tail assembly chaperone [Amphibacillus cookii]|uniref:tail assembly chaperone n=1 Tax=Amphibacillus cookii TaxID=767787 RepID=UPI00195C9F38|nr:tail assembly chaperone [Amphibacillus cookii]MBM7542357.1 hypothetical protein [Amphibacillus cookii]